MMREATKTPPFDGEGKMPTVELEVPIEDLASMTGRHIPEGVPIEVDYDSSFGGEQTARGRLDKLEHDEVFGRMTAGEARRIGRAKPGDLLVGDRFLRRGLVRSVRSGRKVGRPERARVQVPLDTAEDIVSRWGRHDVDRHEEGTVIQFWEGDEYEGEAVMPHLEDGEPLNPAYGPRTAFHPLEDEDIF